MRTWNPGSTQGGSPVGTAVPSDRAAWSGADGPIRRAGGSAGAYLALLLLCVLTRVASTIRYIEDTDSLRFALSLDEYSIAKLQPHFPGYPVFSFLGRLLYEATGSFAIAFSVLGGLSVFGIIVYLLKILKLELTSLTGLALTVLVFFNPLFWLMSNRYMPDLLGAACALAAFYYLVVAEDGRARMVGLFLTGLLAGVRLSYLPFLIVPVAAVARGTPRRAWLAGAGGVAVWLLPMIALTGMRDLWNAALRQTEGHFADFGGTVITDPVLIDRIAGLVQGVWADGLGAYWAGRHPVTLALALGVLLLAPMGLAAARDLLPRRVAWLAVAGWVVYLLWILGYQNVIYKSRHVLPLLPFLLAVIALGLVNVRRQAGYAMRTVAVVFLLAYPAVTLVLVAQHRQPTAIAQVAAELRDGRPEALHVLSIPLVNYYLDATGVDAVFLSVEEPADRRRARELATGDRHGRLLVVGDYQALLAREPVERRTFYHNPYVNRMWPEVEVFSYAHVR